MTEETDIVSIICTELQKYQNIGKLYFIRNNTGTIRKQNRFIRMGKPGSSDIIVWFKNNICEFWEVKTPIGKLNKNQEEFKKEISKLGYQYRIIRSIDDAVEIIINITKIC